MNNVMVDLETLDTVPTAAIVSIGAVVFDAVGIEHEFYATVRWKSCTKLGLTQSAETLDWWAKQSPQAQAVFHDPDAQSLEAVLIRFSAWLEGHPNVKVWGNGASFDNVILQNAYRAAGLPLPWKFWNDRCYRTISSYAGAKRAQLGTHHNALDDARSQAQHLIDRCGWAIV